MTIADWARNKIRNRPIDSPESVLITPFPLADMAMKTWPYVCVAVSNRYLYDRASEVIRGCKILYRQVREEMDMPEGDFVVVTNSPFDGKFVIVFESVTNAVQCRMICEPHPDIEITAGY